jgi:chromosome segregation ATPase
MMTQQTGRCAESGAVGCGKPSGWRRGAVAGCIAALMVLTSVASATEPGVPAKPAAPVGGASEAAIQGLQAENAALKQQLAEMQQLRTDMAARAKELADISARLRDMEGMAQSLRTQRVSFEKQITTLNQALEASRAEVALVRQENGVLRGKFSSASQETDRARAELGEAKAKLTEATQKLEDLRNKLGAATGQQQESAAAAQTLRTENAALRQQLSARQSEAESLRKQLEETRAQSAQAVSEAGKRAADLESQLVSVTAERDEARAALQGRTTQIGALKAQLAGRESEVGKLSQQLKQAEAEAGQLAAAKQSLDQQLEALKGQERDCVRRAQALEAEGTATKQRLADLANRVPPEQGGQATLRGAQERAAKVNADYLALREQTTKGRDGALRSKMDRLWRQLVDAQALVAQLEAAHGLYTVRPGVTVSTIAAAFYGDGGRWPEIVKANAHVLEDPDRIVPGMVLVIP